MADTFEKRVSEIENLVWDIPNILNARFTRVEAALADNTQRIASLERILSSIQTDMRDLRGGVTRQLVEQDKRFGALDQKLDAILARLPQG